ncbi:blue light receptor [Daldinia eschscholtzii]|uniref:Blue light receptor n=1 Tax=Daldinia eschscholtzii TaxID=292717 RepID=A0AAX6MLW6_9PEZI
MDNFFGNQLSQEELQRRHSQQRNQRRLVTASINQSAQQAQYGPVTAANPGPSLVGADSLDDIMCNNSQDLQRRRSLPQQFPGQIPPVDADRRMSMMEFGSGDNAFRDYQFGVMSNAAGAMNNGYPTLNTNIPLQGTSGFTSPTMLADDFSTLSPDMVGNMIAFSNMNMGQMSADPSMNMFSPGTALPTPFSSNSMDGLPAEFSMDLSNDNNALGSVANNPGGVMPVDTGEDSIMTTSPQFSPTNQHNPQANIDMDTAMNGFQPSISPQPVSQVQSQTLVSSTSSYESPIANTTETTPESAAPSQPSIPAVINPQPPKEKTIYSKSGFDMLRALWLVATRKNPQVNLGAVDMSCAFVVCDVTMNDCPIIYVSDNFQNLTGYSQHEIVGQNCRFLQAPDGKVEAGTKREFVDNGAVYNLKQKIAEGKEVQQSLINYRKGGKPFLNLLTMIPIPWDTSEIRYIIGFQIDLVECPDAIASHQGPGTMKVNYKHSDIGQYIWTPPSSSQWEPENGQTLGVDDVSTLLQQFNPKGAVSDWHRQSWDKMLLENADDVVHVLSLKGLFLYLSPSCKRILEYDAAELVGSSISSISHPSDIVPVTRELKDATNGSSVNIVFRIRRKQSGYTWFESHGSLFVEQGKGRKCIILVGRKRPVFALSRRELELNGGIGDSELWTKLSTSGMFLFVSANVRSLLDLQPENLVGTSIQDLMRKESRTEFGRSIEKARRGRIVTCKHEVQNRRGQVLQAHTIMYPGDACKGQKPTFLLAQTKLVKASSRAIGPAVSALSNRPGSVGHSSAEPKSMSSFAVVQGAQTPDEQRHGLLSAAAGGAMAPGNQDKALASDDNIFDELKTTRCTSWQYELRQMEKVNRVLAEELHGLLSNKKKRKRRKGVGNFVRDCANCHTRNTPEWRRGPSGQRDLCNSCGLRWAKQTGRVSPRNSSRGGNGDATSKKSNSPVHSSPLQREVPTSEISMVEQPSETDTGTTINRSSGSNVIPSTGSISTTSSGSRGYSMPPPSLPLLGGGAVGSEMTAIQEEREVSM